MECTHRFQNLLHQVELNNYNFVDFEEFNLMLNDLSVYATKLLVA